MRPVRALVLWLIVAGVPHGARASFPWHGGALDECRDVDQERYQHLRVCAESHPAKNGRRFVLTFRDSRQLDESKQRHKQLASTEIELEPGEYLDYRNFDLFHFQQAHLLWVPVVRGVPDAYESGFVLIYRVDLAAKTFERMSTRFVCLSKCSAQFVSYQSGQGKTTLTYESTVNGQSLRSTWDFDGQRLRPLEVEEPKDRDALTRGRKAPASMPVCKRTRQVQREIARRLSTKRKCHQITAEDLSRVTFLALDRKDIARLQPGDFTGMENLTRIDLSHNPLQKIEKDLFAGLFKLRSLNFQGCQLTTVPAGGFSDLGSLHDLYLNHNRLERLPADAFEGLSSLTFLSLNNNRLRELPDGVFAPCQRLKNPYLSGNPLSKSR